MEIVMSRLSNVLIESLNAWDDGSTANGYSISFRPSLKKILQD